MSLSSALFSKSGLCLFLGVINAAAQTAAPRLLTIDEAVTAAMKSNRRVQSSALDVHRAEQGTAATRTQRLPQFSVYVLGGESPRSFNFTIPQGVLGVYPGVGPIPAQSSTITTPRTFTGLILGQATQPLTQYGKFTWAFSNRKSARNSRAKVFGSSARIPRTRSAIFIIKSPRRKLKSKRQK